MSELIWNEEQDVVGYGRWHGGRALSLQSPWALTSLSPLQEQRSAVFVILLALITILILYSSNSANEVFHYGSLRGRSRRPTNLKKWGITDGYVPILGNKVGQPLGGAPLELLVADPPHCPPLLPPPTPLPLSSTPSISPKERADSGRGEVKALDFSAFSPLFVNLDECPTHPWTSVLSRFPPLALKSCHLLSQNSFGKVSGFP